MRRVNALSTRAYENMTGVVMANPPGKNAGNSCTFSPICWDNDGDVDNMVLIADAETSFQLVNQIKKRIRHRKDEEKLAFMEQVIKLNREAPKKGIEMSIVKRSVCNPFLYPTPFELHFSNAHLNWFLEKPQDYIAKMNETDPDLAAHFTITRAYGKVLYGAKISDVFGTVPKEDYIDASGWILKMRRKIQG